MTYNVFSGTLNPTQSINRFVLQVNLGLEMSVGPVKCGPARSIRRKYAGISYSHKCNCVKVTNALFLGRPFVKRFAL